MALSLARLCLIRASNTALKKFITPSAFSITGNNFFVHKKFISTTNKQKDTIAVDKGHVENSIYGPETENLRDKDEVNNSSKLQVLVFNFTKVLYK